MRRLGLLEPHRERGGANATFGRCGHAHKLERVDRRDDLVAGQFGARTGAGFDAK